MFDSLIVYNLPASAEIDVGNNNFVLKTCQRTLIASYEEIEQFIWSENYRGSEAYSFLLETICGLQSKFLAENEIVNQFKKAYREFLIKSGNNKIGQIIEKLFSDSKKIRTNYLKGISRKSYSYIARKKILKNNPEKVIIIGSGMLAKDLILQLKNKTKLYVCARNEFELEKLSREYDIEIVNWRELNNVFRFSNIINTVGFDGTLLGPKFFKNWENAHNGPKIFLDLSSPSPINYPNRDNCFVSLEEIFKDNIKNEHKKNKQINLAKKNIRTISLERSIFFKNKDFNSNLYKS